MSDPLEALTMLYVWHASPKIIKIFQHVLNHKQSNNIKHTVDI